MNLTFDKRQQKIIQLWSKSKPNLFSIGSEFIVLNHYKSLMIEFNPEYTKIAERKLINDKSNQ